MRCTEELTIFDDFIERLSMCYSDIYVCELSTEVNVYCLRPLHYVYSVPLVHSDELMYAGVRGTLTYIFAVNKFSSEFSCAF